MPHRAMPDRARDYFAAAVAHLRLGDEAVEAWIGERGVAPRSADPLVSTRAKTDAVIRRIADILEDIRQEDR